jgi:hypothetical protein
MKKMTLSLIVLLFSAVFAQELIVDNNGYKLQNYYLGLNVENLWLRGYQVSWLTGVADTSTSGSTHCSAFVAAACQRLNTYILRPPDHSQTLLANAQFDWLQSPSAAQNGWVLITDPDPYKIFFTAQDLANKGYVVTATCKNPDTTESGHIAMVMPGQISLDSLNSYGPFVIMAGTNNYNRISLLRGFSSHIDSWPEHSIWFYYNRNINSVSTIISLNGGNWSSPATWVGGTVPGSSDNVIIDSGKTIIIDDPNAACENISFENSTAHLSMNNSSSVLSVYGDFVLGSSTHQVFTTWPSGAKIKFKGTAPAQTLGEWNTSGNSTSFMEIEVDKSAGKVVTGGSGSRFCFGTSLNIINGTFELAYSDDIETKNLSNQGTQAAITLQSNGIFNMVGGTSYYRKGTFAGEETGKSGIITVYGTAYIAGGSTYRLNILGINIEEGGLVIVPSGRGTVAGSFNIGTVSIKSGGTFQNDLTTAYWYNNTVTPTLLDIQDGGELNITTSTFPMPQSLTANGTVRFSKTDSQTLPASITTYNNLILSGSGVKSLGSSILVNGNFSLRGTASLSLGGFNLNYGPSAVLQYGAPGQVSSQTTSDVEWPASGGPQNVNIYNSGGVTLHSNRTILGMLTLSSGVFDNNGSLNNKIITLGNGATIRRAAGSLSVAPSFAGSINLDYFSNVVSDTTSYEMPASSLSLNNLMISSTKGVTLGSNVTVNGTLTLAGSNLNTSLTKLLILSQTGTISGGSSVSFINGPLARTIAAATPTALDYPIGKGTAFRHLQLTITQSGAVPTIYTAEQFNNAPASRTLSGSLVNVSSIRYFNITKGAGASVTASSVRISYGADDLISDAAGLRIAKDNGAGSWVDLGGSGSAPASGTITSTINFTTFSDFGLANTQRKLSLKALIEGFYNPNNMIPDTVTIELHNINSPYSLVDSKKGVLNTIGVGSFGFTTAVNGIPYYLVMKHRNSIETWSSSGQTFTSSALSYDFTTAASQSYGSNMIQKGSEWCVYSGDMNQDGLVDSGDLGLVDNDNANYISGYVSADVNGDGIVDSGDLGIVDNNNAGYVGKAIPTNTSTKKVHQKLNIKNNK